MASTPFAGLGDPCSVVRGFRGFREDLSERSLLLLRLICNSQDIRRDRCRGTCDRVGERGDTLAIGRVHPDLVSRERVRLSDVSHADVQAWVTALSRSPATVRKVHRILSLILTMAVKDGRLARNVATGVNLPRVVKAERQYLTTKRSRISPKRAPRSVRRSSVSTAGSPNAAATTTG